MKKLIALVSILAMSAVIGAIVIGSMIFDGVVVEDPYETGLVWDQIQKDRENSGIEIKFESLEFAKGLQTINFKLVNNHHANIESVNIKRARPSTALLDQIIPTNHLKNGNYTSQVDFLDVGHWDLVVQVKIEGKTIEFPNPVFVQ